MKRRDLIKKLESAGWYFKRHGDRHDIYKNDKPAGKLSEVQVPRHREIKENLADKILKDAGLK
jgi:mRNA interferase HicA